MKFLNLALLFLFSLNAGARVLPLQDTKPGEDPSFNYQWYLKNHGQTLLVHTDNITSTEITSNQQCLRKFGSTSKSCVSKFVDLEIGQETLSIQSSSQKEVVIAVIDEGLDLSKTENKEELMNQLWHNKDECNKVDGFLIKKTDKDGNGYKNDCMGYDFASKTGRLTDSSGHGTHVASIIAAQINESSVRGITNAVKIMPLKFIPSLQSLNKNPRHIKSLIEAIYYAANNDADIINLSLGVHNIAQKPVAEAIEYALSKNILIVAAAGNDARFTQPAPCKLKGVLCVGSINVNGARSDFSNKSSAIDFYAPGEEILALTKEKHKGSEAMTGTSQAAPMLSALLGLLKIKFPRDSNDKLVARVHSQALNLTSEKDYGVGGIIQFDSSLTKKPKTTIRPVFKELETLVTRNSSSARFKLPIKSYLGKSDIKIRLKSLSEGIKFSRRNHELSVESGREGLVSTKIKFDSNTDSKFYFSVKLSYKGFEKTFYHFARVANRPEKLLAQQNALTLKNPKFSLSDQTRVFSGKNTRGGFYNLLKKGTTYKIEVAKIKSEKLEKTGEVTVEHLYRLLMVKHQDLNSDGTPDYLISYLSRKPGSRFKLNFLFLDENLNSLFPTKVWNVGDFDQKSTPLSLNTEVVTLDIKDMSSKFPIVLFYARLNANGGGDLSETDTDVDGFAHDRLASASEDHVYYFQPQEKDGSWDLKTRTLTSSFLYELLQRNHKIKPNVEIKLSNFYQSAQNQIGLSFLSGVKGRSPGFIRLNVGSDLLHDHMYKSAQSDKVREEVLRKGYRSDYVTLRASALGLNAKLSIAKPSLMSTDQVGSNQTEWLFAPAQKYAVTTSVSNANNNSVAKSFQTETPFEYDIWANPIYAFENDDSRIYFVESEQKRWVLDENKSSGRVSVDSKEVVSSSFVRGQAFNTYFTPLQIKGRRNTKPAVFIDESSVSAQTSYVWEYSSSAQKSVEKIKWTVLSDNCFPLKPGNYSSTDAADLVYNCGGHLILAPLN